MRAWLQARFSGLTDIDDLIQETYVRVLQVRDRSSIREPRAFLFAAARNLALNALRHRKVITFEAMSATDEALLASERPTAADLVERRQELELLTQAIQSLPERCQEVLTLRKIYGLPQREIAARLGICEHTVEVQVGIGVRRCEAFLARHGLP